MTNIVRSSVPAGPSSRASSGFTLIELLVSLAILSLASTLLLGGLATAGVVARQARGDENASAQVGAAQMILRNRLEQMRPVARLNSREPMLDMQGKEQLFDFYGAPGDRDRGAGQLKYRLLLTAPGDLILYQIPELVDNIDRSDASIQGWRGTTLLRGVSSLSIGYFGAIRVDPGRKWRSSWRDSAIPPEAVRIRLTFREGDRRDWPELIVRPATTIDLDCDPEAASRRCGATT